MHKMEPNRHIHDKKIMLVWDKLLYGFFGRDTCFSFTQFLFQLLGQWVAVWFSINFWWDGYFVLLSWIWPSLPLNFHLAKSYARKYVVYLEGNVAINCVLFAWMYVWIVQFSMPLGKLEDFVLCLCVWCYIMP